MMKSSCTTASKEASHTDNDPITPFRLLAQSYTTSSSLRPLINQVLSQPKIYAGFADLLHMPHISQVLSSTSDVVFLNTLELFAYGVYEDYLNSKERYLGLSSNQMLKLKQLSVISAISNHNSPYVPYTLLYQTLHIESIRELEDLLMECIYANIIVGKCDQKRMCFICSGISISRDVRLEHVQDYITILEKWQKGTRNLLEILSGAGGNAAKCRMVEEEFWNRVDVKGRDARNKDKMDMEISIGMVEDAGESRKASKRSRAGIIAASEYTSSFARRG